MTALSRLLVVSPTPSLAMGLAGARHHAVVLRPAELDSAHLPPADLIVLDCDQSRAALDLLERLRPPLRCPALVLLPEGPGLTEVADAGLPSVATLAKPVTRATFLQAVGVSARMPKLRANGTSRAAPSEAPPSPRRHRSAPARSARPTAPEPSAPSPPTRSTPPATPRRRTAGPALAAPEPAAPSPVEPPATAASPLGQPSDQPIDLVRHLIKTVGTLDNIADTGRAILEDAMERVRADRATLLVPDGARWRVAAGVGLRPLERRSELTTDSWLVHTIASAEKGLVIEDSDIARQPLKGAPLASSKHLLVAPVRRVSAIMLLGRKADPPFDEADLAVLAVVGDEAGDLLEAALDVRALARLLEEFRDAGD